MKSDLRLLVVDIETTGLDELRCGIVEIGAVWLWGGQGGFHAKCRPRVDALIEAKAMEINGCDWHNDPAMPRERDAVAELFRFVGAEPVILCAQNPKHDYAFLKVAARYFSLTMPFVHRTMDMHTLAVSWALRNGREVPARGIYTDHIYEMLGLEPEPKPHRALVGARKEAEAFAMMLDLQVLPGADPVPYAFCDPLPASPLDVRL